MLEYVKFSTASSRSDFIIYLHKLNVLKSVSFSYVQNMIENMILTSFLEK